MKILFSWFLLWLQVVELFSIREAFSFVIKVWKWGEKYLWANSTKRHNSVMQIFPLYLCTVIQPTQRRPQACWGTCFPVFSYIVLQTWRMLLCGLPQILITVVHQFICFFFFIRWKQNIQYVGDLQFAVCSYWGKRPELKEGKCVESEK